MEWQEEEEEVEKKNQPRNVQPAIREGVRKRREKRGRKILSSVDRTEETL